ncbi:hypothetical protein ACRAWD_12770 [Caulobacter segnis]
MLIRRECAPGRRCRALDAEPQRSLRTPHDQHLRPLRRPRLADPDDRGLVPGRAGPDAEVPHPVGRGLLRRRRGVLDAASHRSLGLRPLGDQPVGTRLAARLLQGDPSGRGHRYPCPGWRCAPAGARA